MKVGREPASAFLISIVLTPVSSGFTALNSSRVCYSIARAVRSCVIRGALLCRMPRQHSWAPGVCHWAFVSLEKRFEILALVHLKLWHGKSSREKELYVWLAPLVTFVSSLLWAVEQVSLTRPRCCIREVCEIQTKEKKYGSKVTASEGSLRRSANFLLSWYTELESF